MLFATALMAAIANQHDGERADERNASSSMRPAFAGNFLYRHSAYNEYHMALPLGARCRRGECCAARTSAIILSRSGQRQAGLGDRALMLNGVAELAASLCARVLALRLCPKSLRL